MNEVVLIGSDKLGEPDQQLGEILLGNFLRILGDQAALPKYIILWNGGVNIAAKGDSVGFLKKLEERGVKIISCRTCVDYYKIEDEIAVGEIDGMIRIIEILSNHNVLTV